MDRGCRTGSGVTEITCILSAILGNRILSSRIAESVDRCISSSSAKIWFDGDTYRKYPAPRLVQKISALESEVVARKMLKDQVLCGTLVINGYTLALAVRAQSKHLIVATDATPRLTAKMRIRSGGISGVVHRLLDAISHRRFKQLVRSIDAWLPISETCKKSLVADYGADPGRCYVTRAPQPVIDVGAVRKTLSKNPELLFVGNDFRRKGGHTVLDAFRHGLLPKCQLTIISNDDSLKDITVQRVNVVRGLFDPAQIASYYKRADLLVLPTLYDIYPNVVCEGMAFGLPFVATTIGAIGDLVDESRAGLPLEPKCTPRQLATVVMDLLGNEARYLAMSRAACAYACDYLAVALLDNQIKQALLRVGDSVGAADH